MLVVIEGIVLVVMRIYLALTRCDLAALGKPLNCYSLCLSALSTVDGCHVFAPVTIDFIPCEVKLT